MSEINPMEENVDYINESGNGVRMKQDGTPPKILSGNTEIGEVLDSSKNYCNVYTPDMQPGSEGVENVIGSECTYQVMCNKFVRVQGYFTYDYTFASGTGSVDVPLPINSNINEFNDVRGFLSTSGDIKLVTSQTPTNKARVSFAVENGPAVGRFISFEFFYQIEE